MQEENETLIYLPQNYFSLKHHQTLLTIPFHQAAKLFPRPSPLSQKQHTFSLKLKSIHRQSRRPFHSNILKLSFPFKPKGDSRPLRRSTPEFSCVCRLRPLPPPPLSISSLLFSLPSSSLYSSSVRVPPERCFYTTPFIHTASSH